MMVTIDDVKPEDNGNSRVYFRIDNEPLESLMVNHTDLNSQQTLENAIKELLKGRAFKGITFEI